jgi:hypothetical protein
LDPESVNRHLLKIVSRQRHRALHREHMLLRDVARVQQKGSPK